MGRAPLIQAIGSASCKEATPIQQARGVVRNSICKKVLTVKQFFYKKQCVHSDIVLEVCVRPSGIQPWMSYPICVHVCTFMFESVCTGYQRRANKHTWYQIVVVGDVVIIATYMLIIDQLPVILRNLIIINLSGLHFCRRNLHGNHSSHMVKPVQKEFISLWLWEVEY